MSEAAHRYRSHDEDSGRWQGFAFRPGDIVISTRSKSGTTWMQMICALLVFRSADLPAPLADLSPWLDWLVRPRDQVFAMLQAQTHRRFIKTHTPLDGVPSDPRVTYVVVARHPLDMAVSMYHHSANIDRIRLAELTGRPAPQPRARTLEESVWSWVESDADPRESLDSLAGVLWHYRDAWERRHAENVVLVHYDDLRRDLDGQMRRLATRLGVEVEPDVWPGLVQAATFDRMSAHADTLAPDRTGVLRSREAFFRQGSSGQGQALLTAEQVAVYRARVARLAPPDLLAWLHGGSAGVP